ncbi:hypothetical protein HPB49_009048 [Dermacentor silvarum]|uniref:Uncharacterized protein n=1 Tax=Dermacentor silvarum TaxID=543639 RepID=A0ACB8DBJ6_DERSI|nr:hypothetical protein HPB49_009048 [Dermacentor silvarum]
MDVVSVEGEYITKEYAEEPGWHTVGKGKQANVESGVPGNKDQGKRLLSEVLARNKCTKGQKVRQVILASKMPNLPKEDYKIIMRPRGGFKVTNYGLDRLGCCVRNAAGIPRGESEGDIVCVNYKQNILVVSTPSDDHAAKYRHITSLKIGNEEFDTSAYEAAPENTSKGIIRGISLEESPKDIWENLAQSILLYDRLLQTKTGRHILRTLDIQYLKQKGAKVPMVSDLKDTFLISPIPRNMHPAYNAERRPDHVPGTSPEECVLSPECLIAVGGEDDVASMAAAGMFDLDVGYVNEWYIRVTHSR